MFKKYTSIENTYRKEFLDRILGHELWDKTYIIQEKAHGANISFWTTDGVNFTAAKRTADLQPGEKFYNFEQVLEANLDSMKAIWVAVQKEVSELHQLTFYGELIGGHYPHESVEKVKNAIKVQKGVSYCPDNRFYAFDIQVNCDSFLDVDHCNELFESNNMLYAKTLFEGKLEECLAYSNEFDSTIPALMGLPAISPNICEGVVIKPKESCFFNNGTRVILKNKNEKWSEREKKPKKSGKAQEPLPEKVVELREALATYATANRLYNVLSKIGEVTMQDFGQIIGAFNKDAIVDFLKDYGTEFSQLEKSEQKMVNKSVATKTSRLIKDYFKGNL